MKYLLTGILVLSWMLPLHFPPWVSWHSELLIFFSVFLAAWVSLAWCKRIDQSGTVKLPLLALPFVLLALLAFGQLVCGLITFAGDALVTALYAILCVICLTVGYVSTRQPTNLLMKSLDERNEYQALTWLAVSLALGAFASAIVAFAQVFELWEQASWINRMHSLRRPGGNLGQPNQLGTLLLMGMVSLLFLHEACKLPSLPTGLTFLTLCVALAATESRTGILSFLLLAGWWYIKTKHVGFRTSPWAVGFACLVFVVLFWTWPLLFDWMQQNSDAASVVNTKPGYRLIVWPQLLEAVAQRPWFGWGLNQVSKAHNSVVDAHVLSEPYTYSHNIVLDLALGVGIPLTVLLVLVAGGWLLRRIRSTNQLSSWYCLAVALPLAVHSMLEFPFAYAYFLVPVMFALGVLEGMVGGKTVLQIGVHSAAALLLGVTVVGAWSVVEYSRVEEDFRVVRFEALRLGSTPTDYQKPEVILLTQLDALLKGGRISPKPGMTAEELALAQKVALRYPWTATQNRYALALALNGNPEEAMRQLRVMRAMHGEKAYGAIKANWNGLTQDKYPQLRELKLP